MSAELLLQDILKRLDQLVLLIETILNEPDDDDIEEEDVI